MNKPYDFSHQNTLKTHTGDILTIQSRKIFKCEPNFLLNVSGTTLN